MSWLIEKLKSVCNHRSAAFGVSVFGVYHICVDYKSRYVVRNVSDQWISGAIRGKIKSLFRRVDTERKRVGLQFTEPEYTPSFCQFNVKVTRRNERSI